MSWRRRVTAARVRVRWTAREPALTAHASTGHASSACRQSEHLAVVQIAFGAA
jgi:hypothetical protein